jgi:hypothetical protein
MDVVEPQGDRRRDVPRGHPGRGQAPPLRGGSVDVGFTPTRVTRGRAHRPGWEGRASRDRRSATTSRRRARGLLCDTGIDARAGASSRSGTQRVPLLDEAKPRERRGGRQPSRSGMDVVEPQGDRRRDVPRGHPGRGQAPPLRGGSVDVGFTPTRVTRGRAHRPGWEGRASRDRRSATTSRRPGRGSLCGTGIDARAGASSRSYRQARDACPSGLAGSGSIVPRATRSADPRERAHRPGWEGRASRDRRSATTSRRRARGSLCGSGIDARAGASSRSYRRARDACPSGLARSGSIVPRATRSADPRGGAHRPAREGRAPHDRLASQAGETGDRVEPGIEAQDPAHPVALHDGDVKRVAGG